MASPVTFGSMKLQARQKADQVNSKFVSDSELNGYTNASIKDLYDRLVLAGEFYYISQFNISTAVYQPRYDLPADFYKLLGVDLILDASGNAVTLKPFAFSERNSFLYTPSFNIVGLNYLRYMVQGNQIEFVPVGSATNQVKIWYAPIFTSLVNDSDTFDGINGWEEYVINDVAIKMMAKEESDCSILIAQKGQLIERIDEMKLMRDLGSPAKVEDVSRQMPWEFWAFKNY